MEPAIGDALGEALLAYLADGEEAGGHVIERDDGYINADSPVLYFTDIPDWFPVEKSVPQRVHGRVLDIGAGGGRFAIALQELGHDVTALDVSPGCLEACRRRGVHNTFAGTIFDLAATSPEPFDTFLLMGHNIGLLGGPDHAPVFLDALRSMARPGARLLGSGRDPEQTDDPDHLAYQEMNRKRGRRPGQLIIRVRWRAIATDWFDYWFLPVAELESLAMARGWRLADTVYERDHYLVELRLAS